MHARWIYIIRYSCLKTIAKKNITFWSSDCSSPFILLSCISYNKRVSGLDGMNASVEVCHKCVSAYV